MDESCCAALPVLATCDMAIATCRLQIVLVLITLEQNCSPGDRSSVEDQIFAESLADAEMLRILGDHAVPKVGLKLDFDCTCHPDKHACHKHKHQCCRYIFSAFSADTVLHIQRRCTKISFKFEH